jgi:predicted nucleotide-binding protein
MPDRETESRLIAVSLVSLQDQPYIGPDGRVSQQATLLGESLNPELSFQFKTGLLNPEQRERCEALRRHGSTVVEAPLNWRYGYSSPELWQEFVIRTALERVATLEESTGERERMSGYDDELAERILEALNGFFPNVVGTIEIKARLNPEPSDEVLLTALAALELDKLIDAKILRTGYDQVPRVAMNIRLNAEGRKHLRERTANMRSSSNNRRIENPRRAFIVHGHDHGSKETVARFLEKLDIEPTILHEQADKGKTIIEKFEAHAAEVAYAIVILTGDDVAYAKSQPDKSENRARQNVIFELGFFVGKLGRTHTFALLQEGVALPSDMNGIIYIKLDDDAWRVRLAKELKATGLEIDLNQAF